MVIPPPSQRDIHLSHIDYIQGNQSCRGQSIFHPPYTFVFAVYSVSLQSDLVSDVPQSLFSLGVPVVPHLPPPYRRSLPQVAVLYVSSFWTGSLSCLDYTNPFYLMTIATKIASNKRMIESCQLCWDEMLKIESPNMSRRPPRPAWIKATTTKKIRIYCFVLLITYCPDKRARVSSEGGNNNKGGCAAGVDKSLGSSCVIRFIAIEISKLF